MANLNPVEATVTVAGTKCHFIRLKLDQAFNAHHTFRIEIDFEEFGGKWMDDPTKMINFIGKDATITMKHKETGEQNLFSGIITNMSMTGYHGQQNIVVVTGSSPTIKLAGKPTMDSFMDLPLQQVVDEAIANSGNGCAVTVNPVFKSKLDYTSQYHENCWDFLNRLSWQFGEWFFYNGTECFFGKKQGESATLEYDKEMTYFDLSANLAPGKFNRYHYLVHDDKEIDKDNPSDVPGVRGYLEVSKGRAESVYTSETTTPLDSQINTKKDLDDLVKAEKSRTVGEMLTMRGATQTCKIKIGSNISVRLPSKMDVTAKSVDTFLITQVTHEVDQKGHYSNSFEGIMSGIEVIPMAEPRLPVATNQIATVVKNVDEKERGRIKVQFQWQSTKGKTTNWIRVQTLDAGGSGAFPKNRGHVFIPEIDDQVMIGFEYGDPSRPFVSGSMFPETKAKGGEIDNNIKSIKTRSGHMIEFNDEVTGGWGITIKDDCGNKIHLSTKGKNIDITAPETITLSAKNIQVNANENIKMSAGDDIIESAGKNKTDTAGEDHITSAKNKKTFVEEDLYTQVKKNVKVDVLKDTKVNVDDDVYLKAGKLSVNVVDEDTFIKSTGKITLKSGDIVDVAQG